MLATIGAGALIAYLIINLVHLTHGEQTPTYLGVERSRMVCRYGARPLHWFYVAISPIITLGDWVAKWTLRLFGIEMTGAWLETEADVIESRVDLRHQLGSVLEDGDVGEDRREEVLNAFRIGDRPVREEMLPAEDIVALSTELDVGENLRRMADHPHTRYPLVGGDLTAFEGVVYAPVLERHRVDLLDGELDLLDVAAPPMTMSPDTAVSDAIDQFQTENQELALVIERGDIVGLVTVTDLLEAIMGEIEDPLDREDGNPIGG